MVIDYNAEIPARHVASTVAMGIATGNEERTRVLAALYTDKLADIRRRVTAASGKPKVYVELGNGGAGVVGNTYWKGMWGRLLDFAGADNIAAGRIPGAWAPLNPEYVLAADPDAIFIAGSSWVGKPNAVMTGFDASPTVTRASLAPYANRQGGPSSRPSAPASFSPSSTDCRERCSTTRRPISSPGRSSLANLPTSTRSMNCASTTSDTCR